MRLQRRCADEPSFARRLLAEALCLRDAIYRLDAALAQNHGPAQDDVDMIAATHAACLGRGRLTTQDGGFGWTWTVESAPLEAILGPIAASAMAVITGGRPCEAEAVPGPSLRLALPRYDQEQQPALVRDGGLRQQSQAEAPSRPLKPPPPRFARSPSSTGRRRTGLCSGALILLFGAEEGDRLKGWRRLSFARSSHRDRDDARAVRGRSESPYPAADRGLAYSSRPHSL